MKVRVIVAWLFFAPAAYAASIPVTVETQQGKVPLTLEVAATEAQRMHGLMQRTTLQPGDGMLFAFPSVNRTSFWMKDTLIPLDILFVAQDGNIVHIAPQTVPLSLKPIASGGEYATAIEIDGGRAAKEHIREGDHVRFTLPKDAHVE